MHYTGLECMPTLNSLHCSVNRNSYFVKKNVFDMWHFVFECVASHVPNGTKSVSRRPTHYGFYDDTIRVSIHVELTFLLY